MVVLSASVCTRQGKALVSRQYVEMTRLRVEGLLAAFPKLLGHAMQQNHTFVETDTVRYVYQPLENQLFLLLVTTKASNIVEDLNTLRLLAKVIPDVAGSIYEDAINEHGFELIFAFDEVLTSGGYREDTNLSAIRTNLLMDSHEEKIANMLKQSKIDAAKGEMQKKEKAIRARQMTSLKNSLLDGSFQQQAIGGGGGGGKMPGFGMDSFEGGGGQMGGFEQPPPFNGSNGFGTYGGAAAPSAKPEAPRVVAKGMKLGGGGAAAKKKDSLMAAMAAEDNLMPLSKKSTGLSNDLAAAAPVAAPPSAPVTLVAEEKITVQMNREGGVESCEIKGTLTLTANTELGTQVTVGVNKAALAPCTGQGWTIATHPKVAKPQYEQSGVLGLKDARKGFPMGRPIGVLRWSYGSAEAAPFTLNCWPEDMGDGTITVNIEYELQRSNMLLTNVNILIPLGTTDPPAVESIDGAYKHDPRAGMMCWHHDEISASNSTGSLEFSIAGSNTDAFFPVQMSFSSENLFLPLELTGVTSLANGSNVPNVMTKLVTPESYQCE